MTTEAELATPSAKPTTATSALSVPSWTVMIGVLVVGTGLHTYLHHREHGVYDANQIAIGFFLILNLMVNFWEFGLYFCGDQIRQEWLDTREEYAGRPIDRFNEVFLKPVPITRLLSFREWTGIWSSYALVDPGYARRGSFGYNIDVGNGFSTFIPATLFTIGMTYDIMPARWLGMIGIALFWQMFYGTVVYFFQFFNAGRHIGHRPKDIWIFVGSTNGMWFIFPIWALYGCVQLVLTDSYAFFR